MNRVHRWYCRSDRWRKGLEDRLLPWVLNDVDLGPRMLELGPGPGVTTDLLRERVPELTCIEIDERDATALRERLAGTNVTVVEGDATAMPFPDASFSSVISLTMLHHVPSSEEQDALFREARRVLEPGGVFLGSDSTPSLIWNIFHLFDIRTPVDPQTAPARLEAAGFREVEVEVGAGNLRFRARA